MAKTSGIGGSQQRASSDSDATVGEVTIAGVKGSRTVLRRKHVVRKKAPRPFIKKTTADITPPPQPSIPLPTLPAAEASLETEEEVTITGVTSSGKMMRRKQGARKRALRPIITKIGSAEPSHPPIIPKSEGKSSKGKEKITEKEDSPMSEVKSKGKRKTASSPSKSRVSVKQKVKAQEPSHRPHTRNAPSKAKSDTSANGYDVNLAFSHRFFTAKNKSNWEVMSKRPLLGERPINLENFKGTGILELLEDNNWLLTVTNPLPFVNGIVYEFYSNLCPEFIDPSSAKYLKVYLRGKVFDFSPKVINEYYVCSVRSMREDELELEVHLDCVASELTGSSMVWPKKSNLLAATLTTKYAILLRIALFNWIPKVHSTTISPPIASFLYRVGKGIEVNLGNLIFGKIVCEINSSVARPILGYPSLIFNVLMSQWDVKEDGESFTSLAKPITLSEKLLHGKHFVDIEGERVADHTGQALASSSIPANAETESQLQKIVHDLTELKSMMRMVMQELKDMKAVLIPDLP